LRTTLGLLRRSFRLDTDASHAPKIIDTGSVPRHPSAGQRWLRGLSTPSWSADRPLPARKPASAFGGGTSDWNRPI